MKIKVILQRKLPEVFAMINVNLKTVLTTLL